jgi:hypothetical protein
MSNAAPTGAPPMPSPQGGNPWSASKYVARTFFVYEADIPPANLPLNSGAAFPLTFNIAGDSDFFWTKFTVTAVATNGGGAGVPAVDLNPRINALIINTTTGRQYSSAPVPLAGMAGNGQFPFILPMITLWEKKSTIQIQLQSYNSVDSYDFVQLSFLGIKAFTNN